MQDTSILFKKTTLDSIIVLGKELFEKQYKEFFANRRTVSFKNFIIRIAYFDLIDKIVKLKIDVGDVMHLLMTYDPKMQYASAMQMAHKIHTYINVMVIFQIWTTSGIMINRISKKYLRFISCAKNLF